MTHINIGIHTGGRSTGNHDTTYEIHISEERERKEITRQKNTVTHNASFYVI
jgi:hypothetical protein